MTTGVIHPLLFIFFSSSSRPPHNSSYFLSASFLSANDKQHTHRTSTSKTLSGSQVYRRPYFYQYETASQTHQPTNSTNNTHKPCQPTQTRRPSKEVNPPTLYSPRTHKRPTLKHPNNNTSHNHHRQQLEGQRTQAPSRAHPQNSWTQPSPDPTISYLSTRPSSSSARLLLPYHLVRRRAGDECGHIHVDYLLPGGLLLCPPGDRMHQMSRKV
ncbi:hypothetical protein BKA57DRAFT_181064 [Linnemannia elongata]|nr:hypothetical protein BKA57DRAFT_181064 [Linnemannia elongata]